MRKGDIAAAVGLSAFALSSPALAVDCDGLRSAKIADTTIISAQAVPAGDLTTEDKVTRKNMPAFCRVVASVKDAPDSDVRVELWMPSEGWKGVFHVNGNGGYAGVLAYNYGAMEAAIKRGYASAETDLGMAPATPLNGDALVGHPDKWKDWGMLGTHEAAVAGKQIAKAFYGADAKRSYYTGCSTGGQQGLIEAEYFPEDFDGILAGAPVVSRTWGHAVAVTGYQAANLKPGHKLSDANLALLTKSAVAACGAKQQRPQVRSVHRRPVGLQLRARGADLQGRRGRRLPDPRTGRDRKGDLSWPRRQERQAALLWPVAGQRVRGLQLGFPRGARQRPGRAGI